MSFLQPLLGVLAFVLLAFALSADRQRIPWRRVGLGLLIQTVLGVLFLKAPILGDFLLSLSKGITALQNVTARATQFMFGFLAGGPTPYQVTTPEANFIVAFQVLPLILVVSALSAVLFHWGVLPRVIGWMAYGLQKSFRISGVLAFATASSVFMGIIESPILIKPYLSKLSRSELFTLLCCGMATVAGTVMVLYASVLQPALPGAMAHILTASVMSVPAALILSQIMVPPEQDHLDALTSFEYTSTSQSTIDALMQGTREGTSMVVNIAATLIVLFACVYLLNDILALLPLAKPLTIQAIVAIPLRPLVWFTGIPWAETSVAAELMATKTILNEFVAYLQLSKLPKGSLDARSQIIMVYNMCGFANLGSLGILVGGLGSLMPERRTELVGLALRAVLIGTLATMMTGAIVALLHGFGVQ